MRKGLRRLVTVGMLALVVALLAFGVGIAPAAADGGMGAVYTLSNAAAGNSVLQFNRAANGTLTAAGSFATGGLGSGSGLGSQGAVALSKNNRWLFAVNAGSNDISVFAVRPGGLTLTDRVGSGGMMPISLTTHGDMLFVLNAGGSGNISGFSIERGGQLSPIPGATRPLSNNGVGAAPGPAQVAFSPDGDMLVATEKATNLIDVYEVDDDGMPSGPMTHPSAGTTPFGFEFARRRTLVVSEAFGGAINASAASSYRLDDEAFHVVSASVPTHQTAACWVAVTKNGKYAYTTNTGSSSVSSYRVAADGSLTLLASHAGDTGAGSAPIDAAVSDNSQFLYVLSAKSGTISGFDVQGNGGLSSRAGVSGLPMSAAGLVAR